MKTLTATHIEQSAEPSAAAENQAFQILRFGFAVAPILAGLDKFFGLPVDWDRYLSPAANNVFGGHGHQFMMLVGVIEIIAGIGC
jgi:uncharacterized membrane protein YphA (DoxX/SURF4 family)